MDPIQWGSVMFLLLATLTCGFALAVVLATSVVRMAFYLVLSLTSTAGLFLLAGADFVGAMQIMIYVGGTLVLLVFGVMLTAPSQTVAMRTNSGQLLGALVMGGVLLTLLATSVLRVEAWHPDTLPDAGEMQTVDTATAIGSALEGYRFDAVGPSGEVPADRSGYLFPFLVVSIHLLVVLVGAAYLARTRQRPNNPHVW